ncbi:hypothetical protein [Paraburkholderia sediminicola]
MNSTEEGVLDVHAEKLAATTPAHAFGASERDTSRKPFSWIVTQALVHE